MIKRVGGKIQGTNEGGAFEPEHLVKITSAPLLVVLVESSASAVQALAWFWVNEMLVLGNCNRRVAWDSDNLLSLGSSCAFSWLFPER